MILDFYFFHMDKSKYKFSSNVPLFVLGVYYISCVIHLAVSTNTLNSMIEMNKLSLFTDSTEIIYFFKLLLNSRIRNMIIFWIEFIRLNDCWVLQESGRIFYGVVLEKVRWSDWQEMKKWKSAYTGLFVFNRFSYKLYFKSREWIVTIWKHYNCSIFAMKLNYI